MDLCAPTIRNYLSAQTPEEAYKVFLYDGGSIFDYQNVDIEWERGEDYFMNKVYYDTDPSFSSPSYLYLEKAKWENTLFEVGETYYYKIYDLDIESYFADEEQDDPLKVLKEGKLNKEGHFTTLNSPVRYIGVEGLYNARDLGGWKAGNKTVKYDMLYRGGRPQSLTDYGIKQMDQMLGLQSEIDLRTPGTGGDDYGQESCIFNENKAYLKAPFTAYTYIFPQFVDHGPYHRNHDARAKASLYAIFDHLSKKENYPVYFHCNAGADRTGTLAFLISGLLGVAKEDLTRDFELTSFSRYSYRLRGPLAEDFQYGVMEDDGNNYVAWGEMIDFMMEYYGQGRTLQQAIRNYLVSFVGVEESKLDAIVDLLTE